MIVRELLALLGLEVDEASFEAADIAAAAVEKGMMLIGAAAGAAAAAITSMVEEAGHLNDLADQLGVDAVRLQELGAAAKLSGAGLEDVVSGLRVLSKNAQEAANGNEQLAAAFQKAGIHIKGSDGHIRSLDDLLLQLATKVEKMPAGAERAAMALDLLGRGGLSLLPMLKDGPAGLARLTKEAHELGAIMGADTVEAGDALGDTMDRVSLAVTGLRNLIGAPLLRPILEVVKATLGWVRANREYIATGVERVVRFTVAALRLAVQVSTPFVRALRFLAMEAGGLKLALLLLSAAMLIYTGNALRSAISTAVAFVASMIAKITVTKVYTDMLGKATRKVELLTFAELRAAAAGAAAPYLIAAAWGALLIVLGLLIEDIYTFTQGGDSLLGRWGKWIGQLLQFNANDSGFVRFLKWLGMLLFDTVGAVKYAGQVIGGVFKSIGGAIMAALQRVSSFWNAIGKGEFRKAAGIWFEMLGPFGTYLSWLGRVFGFVWDLIGKLASANVNGILSMGKAASHFLQGEGKKGAADILDGLGVVGDWIGKNVSYGKHGQEVPLDRLFGRGANGAAAVSGMVGMNSSRSTVNAPVFNYQPQIQVGPGTSPEAVAEAGRTNMDRWLNGQLQTTLANLEGG